MKIITLQALNDLETLCRSCFYNVNIQFYNQEWNIYLSRDDVNLHSIGGYDELVNAICVMNKWIVKVNRLDNKQYLND